MPAHRDANVRPSLGEPVERGDLCSQKATKAVVAARIDGAELVSEPVLVKLSGRSSVNGV
jgi:hypothetical protein